MKEDAVTEAERGELRRVNGSLQWLVTHLLVNLNYEVSISQSRITKAAVEDLLNANKLM